MAGKAPTGHLAIMNNDNESGKALVQVDLVQQKVHVGARHARARARVAVRHGKHKPQHEAHQRGVERNAFRRHVDM